MKIQIGSRFRALSQSLGGGLLSVALFAIPAQAFDLNYTSIAGLTNSSVTDILMLPALQADHHAFASATPLGLKVGVEIGADVVAIFPSTGFKSAVSTIGNTGSLSLVPVPRIVIRKGLPAGFDLGFAWLKFSVITSMGLELQKNFLKGTVGPALAGRVSYSSNTISFISTSTVAVDLIASKKLGPIDPYVGLGVQFGSGSLSFGSSVVPTGVSLSQSFSSARFTAGFPLTLAILKFVAEYNSSFAAGSSVGGRFVFSI